MSRMKEAICKPFNMVAYMALLLYVVSFVGAQSFTRCRLPSDGKSIYDFQNTLLDNTPKDLKDYQGHVSLIVNVASF